MRQKNSFTYYTLQFLRHLLCRLPRKTTLRLGVMLGRIAYDHLKRRQSEALEHQRQAFPNRTETYYQAILKRTYEHYGKVFLDSIRLETLDLERIVSVEGEDSLESPDSKQGMILLTGHFGNWEIFPIWFSRKGYSFTPVIRRQKNKGANRFFVEWRSKMALPPLYAGSSTHEMMKVVARGSILGLAADQDARKSGVFVDFLGRPASAFRGPAVFHLKTGAPLITAFCRMDRHSHYHITFERILVTSDDTVETITQKIASKLEEMIREHPEQYFWFHRRWKTQPLSNGEGVWGRKGEVRRLK